MKKKSLAVIEQTRMEEANLAIVDGFYQALVEDKDPVALGTYLSDDFLSNTPSIDGKQGMMDFVASQSETAPKAGFFEILHKIARDDIVVWHYIYGSKSADQPDLLIADFLRLEDGLIIEYWDVVQSYTPPISKEETHQ